MQKVNWGVVGLGSVAKEFVKGFNFSENAKLFGIASNDNVKLNTFKENFKIESKYCFNDYNKLIDEKKIEIVYLALPTFLHKEWVISCLERNKKVLVEKPATMNSEEIFKIKENPKSENCFFEAYMYLFHPQIKKTIELIKEGEIGKIISMESYFGNNLLTKKNWFGFTKKKKIDPKKRIFNKKMGGGSILDLGCYPVSFSTFIGSLENQITFKNVEVLDKKVIIGQTGVELDSYATLKFDNGFISKVGSSFSNNLGRKTEIIGSDGKIIIEDTWTANPSKLIIKKKTKETVLEIKSKKNIYSYEIDALSDEILNKNLSNNKLININQSVVNMQIIDAWKN